MFTAQERAEVLKVVQASKMTEAGAVKIMQFLKVFADLTDNEKEQLRYAVNAPIEALRNINRVLQELLWVYEHNHISRLERPQALAEAWRLLDGVISSVTDARNRSSWVPKFNGAVGDFNDALSLLNTVDRSLSYANPFPSSYPRIIGPHGHYEMAQANVLLSIKYLADTYMRVGGAMNQNPWPNTARANFMMGSVIEKVAMSMHLWNRILAMQGEVVLPEDQASAEFDFEASSRLRPPSFFLAQIAHELAMTKEPFTAFSGREVPRGLAAHYRDILTATPIILAEVGPSHQEFLIKELELAGGIFFTQSIQWSALDHWSMANLGFFFDIPAAPGGPAPSEPAVIPVGYFQQEAEVLDSVSAAAQSVIDKASQIKASLLSKEGKPVEG